MFSTMCCSLVSVNSQILRKLLNISGSSNKFVGLLVEFLSVIALDKVRVIESHNCTLNEISRRTIASSTYQDSIWIF